MCKSMTQIKRRKNIPVVNMHDRDVLPPVCPQVIKSATLMIVWSVSHFN